MNGLDLLWLVFGVLPAAFVTDLGVIGAVALWFYVQKRRRT